MVEDDPQVGAVTVRTLAAAGYRAFLIGERFMTDPDPAAAIRLLIGAAPASGRRD